MSLHTCKTCGGLWGDDTDDFGHYGRLCYCTELELFLSEQLASQRALVEALSVVRMSAGWRMMSAKTQNLVTAALDAAGRGE